MHVELATVAAVVAAVLVGRLWLTSGRRGATAPVGARPGPSTGEPDPLAELYRRTSSGRRRRCRNCGAANDSGVTYCWDCLSALEDGR